MIETELEILAESYPEPSPTPDGRRSRAVEIRVGERFNRLVAVQPAGKKGHLIAWQFRCDCGTLCVHSSAKVKRGRITSCGCQQRKTRDTFRAKAKLRAEQAATRRRTVAREVTQPAADAMRELARILSDNKTRIVPDDDPELRDRVVQNLRKFADIIERGEL
jgi:hypothetical protein